MKEKARLAKIERLRIEGKLVAVDEVVAAWGNILSIVRTRLLAIPTRLAAQTAAATNPRETFKLVTNSIHEALTELSTFDPNPQAHDHEAIHA